MIPDVELFLWITAIIVGIALIIMIISATIDTIKKRKK